MCVHYIEVICAEGTKKSCSCSGLGGVHYVEVHLQQKSIRGTEICVQTGGVHYAEVFTNRDFTAYRIVFSLLFVIYFLLDNGDSDHRKLELNKKNL